MLRCKSVRSELEKIEAVELAPNIYLQRGHLRHLFSTEFIKELFETAHLTCIKNQYVEGEVYGKKAFFVEAIGEKRIHATRRKE